MADRNARPTDDGPVGDRLQPSLLDRLTDNEPDKKVEPAGSAAMTRTRLRQAVLRDLAWLLNASNAETETDFEGMPHARTSTINYGVKALSGVSVSQLEFASIDQALHDSILAFEPRLLPDTLQVRSVVTEDQLSHHNTLAFEVRAKLWSMPYPLELLLRSNLDLETGHVVLQEQTGPAG
jgi:type VI secretion system protein ImpF